MALAVCNIALFTFILRVLTDLLLNVRSKPNGDLR